MSVLSNQILDKAVRVCNLCNNTVSSLNPHVTISRDCSLNGLFTLLLAHETNTDPQLSVQVASIINLASFYSLDIDRFLDRHIERIRRYSNFTLKQLPAIQDLPDEVLLLQSSLSSYLDLHALCIIGKSIDHRLYKKISSMLRSISQSLCFTDNGMFLDEIGNHVDITGMTRSERSALHVQQGIQWHQLPHVSGPVFGLNHDRQRALKNAFQLYGRAFMLHDELTDISEDRKQNVANYVTCQPKNNTSSARERVAEERDNQLEKAIQQFKSAGFPVISHILTDHLTGWSQQPRKGFLGELTERIITRINEARPL